jgi:thiol-disulfide isomerase/thioredoxin
LKREWRLLTRRGWIAAAVGAVAVLALIAGAAWRQIVAWDSESRPKIDGSTILALALPDLSGREQSLWQWKGKVVVVNFWATWCEPCREEMPRFIKLQEEYGLQGLQFVGIAIDQPEKVQRFASDIHLNYPTLLGGYGAIELSKAAGNRYGALPFTVVLDRAGTVVYTQLGPVKDAQLRSMLPQLLL